MYAFWYVQACNLHLGVEIEAIILARNSRELICEIYVNEGGSIWKLSTGKKGQLRKKGTKFNKEKTR